MDSLSISVRLRRVVTEEMHVSVPVVAEVIHSEPREDGTLRLDPEKVFARARAMGEQSNAWRPEGVEIVIHPLQTPPTEVNGGS